MGRQTRSNYQRGFRHGLKAATEMINRFKDSHKNESIRTTLAVLANEVPLIGCRLGDVGEPEETDSLKEGEK